MILSKAVPPENQENRLDFAGSDVLKMYHEMKKAFTIVNAPGRILMIEPTRSNGGRY